MVTDFVFHCYSRYDPVIGLGQTANYIGFPFVAEISVCVGNACM